MRFFNSRFVLVYALLLAGPTASGQRISVSLNGNPVEFKGTPPQEVNGRVMVPLRGVLEEMGAQVRWIPSTRTVTAAKADTNIRLPLGQSIAEVNGRSVPLDVPAMIIRGRTMVPLRFVAESLGGAVTWDTTTRMVRIATASPDEFPRDSRAFVRTRTATRTADALRIPRVSGDEPVEMSLGFLPENAVVPVTLDHAMNSRAVKPGDRISASVELGGFSGRLPRGTRFVGIVRQVAPSSEGGSAAIAAHFTQMILPDGSSREINAVPYPLETRFVEADRMGHLIARSSGFRSGMFVGLGSGVRLARADGLPSGRLRMFLDEDGNGGPPAAGELTIPLGYRFGLKLDRQITFDPVPRLDDR